MAKRKPTFYYPEVWGKLGSGEGSEMHSGLAIVIPDLAPPNENPFEWMSCAVVPQALPWMKLEDILASRLVTRFFHVSPEQSPTSFPEDYYWDDYQDWEDDVTLTAVDSHLDAADAFTGPSTFHQFLRGLGDGHSKGNPLVGGDLWRSCTQPSGDLEPIDRMVNFWVGVQQLLEKFGEHALNSSAAAPHGPNLSRHVLSFLVHLPNQKHRTFEGGYVLFVGDPNISLTRNSQLEVIDHFAEAGFSSPPQLGPLEVVISGGQTCPPPLLRFLLGWLSPKLCKLTLLQLIPDPFGYGREWFKQPAVIPLPNLTELTIYYSHPYDPYRHVSLCPNIVAPQLSKVNLWLSGSTYMSESLILPYLSKYPSLTSLSIQYPHEEGGLIDDNDWRTFEDPIRSLTSLTLSLTSAGLFEMSDNFILHFPSLEKLRMEICFRRGETLNFDLDDELPGDLQLRGWLGGEQMYGSNVWERLPKLMTITVTIRIGSSSTTTTHYTREIHSKQSTWERD